MNCILILAALGALGVCFWLDGFASLAFLWQLPLLFGGFWLALVLLAFLFLALWCLPISMKQPVEEDSKTARRILYLYEELALTLLQVKIHTTGLEKLPREGRFLLVCNHLSLLDPLILHIHTKESQLAFISKRENDRLILVNKLMHKTASPSSRKATPAGPVTCNHFATASLRSRKRPRSPLSSAPFGAPPPFSTTPPASAGPMYSWTCWRLSLPASSRAQRSRLATTSTPPWPRTWVSPFQTQTKVDRVASLVVKWFGAVEQSHTCGHDGIGRRAGFRFLCRKACGFKSHCPHQLRNSHHRFVSACRRKLRYGGNFFAFGPDSLRWTRGRWGRGCGG